MIALLLGFQTKMAASPQLAEEVEDDVSHWTAGLTRGRPPQPESEWLSPDADRIRTRLGAGAVSWAVEVGQDIATRISREIPVLQEAGPQVRRATTSTTLRALTLVAGLGEPDTQLASAEVEEVATDFARRGLELNDLLGSIRVGYAVLAAAMLDAAMHLVPDAERSAELRRVSVLLFEVLDPFTGLATTTFLTEQNAWIAGVSAARLDLVKKIVDDEPVEQSRIDEVLQYPIDGPHLALVAWSRPHSDIDVRAVVDPVLRSWGEPSASVIVPVGLQTIWAWGVVDPSTGPPPSSPPRFPGVSVAVGQPATGLEGFKRSHREARAVEHLLLLRDEPPGGQTHTHREVALESLLLTDPEAAQSFVDHTLGPLAAADAWSNELRTTLTHYLDMDHSLTRVAATEHISKNTVTYRVHKAFDLCGRRTGTSTTDLRAALRVHTWLHRSDNDV